MAAYSVDEVKEIHDKAQAIKTYAIQSENRELVVQAQAIIYRAQRRAGELLREIPKAKGELFRGNKMEPREETAQPLTDLGISKRQSATWQKVAAVQSGQG